MFGITKGAPPLGIPDSFDEQMAAVSAKRAASRPPGSAAGDGPARSSSTPPGKQARPAACSAWVPAA